MARVGEEGDDRLFPFRFLSSHSAAWQMLADGLGFFGHDGGVTDIPCALPRAVTDISCVLPRAESSLS